MEIRDLEYLAALSDGRQLRSGGRGCGHQHLDDQPPCRSARRRAGAGAVRAWAFRSPPDARWTGSDAACAARARRTGGSEQLRQPKRRRRRGGDPPWRSPAADRQAPAPRPAVRMAGKEPEHHPDRGGTERPGPRGRGRGTAPGRCPHREPGLVASRRERAAFSRPADGGAPGRSPAREADRGAWAELREEVVLVQGWDESQVAREFYRRVPRRGRPVSGAWGEQAAVSRWSARDSASPSPRPATLRPGLPAWCSSGSTIPPPRWKCRWHGCRNSRTPPWAALSRSSGTRRVHEPVPRTGPRRSLAKARSVAMKRASIGAINLSRSTRPFLSLAQAPDHRRRDRDVRRRAIRPSSSPAYRPQSAQLQLGHADLLNAVRFEHEIMRDHHSHRETRSNRDCRLNVQRAADDLLAGLIDALRHSLLDRFGKRAVCCRSCRPPSRRSGRSRGSPP